MNFNLKTINKYGSLTYYDYEYHLKLELVMTPQLFKEIFCELKSGTKSNMWREEDLTNNFLSKMVGYASIDIISNSLDNLIFNFFKECSMQLNGVLN